MPKLKVSMELAITCIMDIGNYIISAMDLPEPETYADIPLILGNDCPRNWLKNL
ncbi:MAG: hypothetical protein PWR22_1741 [Moorella sp. (in: firmicutes)]|uniref:hypothetical protein n=1 Tax=unclassified Neomoorella TaxID=2676739 RepID=UPI0010FFB50E|nr:MULTISPECIES: hypothetical protein [unclassified Moorella (in: firmicutes)]MDK2817112.1 hypothetical protein [Moorella sp. (in: firmicutes)]MDK2895710.1 hypothetical protein [Moorella sp. (in: firmicutes)]GEA14254.1 hypothetical protein E308F_04960 [Moorella sp. E308F]GEA18361.1 hypothetical protein E306M_14970 [Moorella sp. E306M]